MCLRYPELTISINSRANFSINTRANYSRARIRVKFHWVVRELFEFRGGARIIRGRAVFE